MLRRTASLVALPALALAGTLVLAAPASAAIDSMAAIQTALNGGGTVSLDATVVAGPGEHLVAPAGSVVLDLNGHDLTINDPGAGQPAIAVLPGADFTITGSGLLTAAGGPGAAGIGGGADQSSGSISVTGDSHVTTDGGSESPGIGGGAGADAQGGPSLDYAGHPGGSGGTVTIGGNAVVDAQGGAGGTGIGGGSGGRGVSSVSSGGDGGAGGAGGSLTVRGSAQVTAAGGGAGAGIGGGRGGRAGSTNAFFGATGGDGGAGATIIIEDDSVVIATGGTAATGVGGGEGGRGGDTGPRDTAPFDGPAGGGGDGGAGGTIATHDSSQLTATGGGGGTGIGGGAGGDGANGGVGGPDGVSGGDGGDAGDGGDVGVITTSDDSELTGTGGIASAGIGGGLGGDGGRGGNGASSTTNGGNGGNGGDAGAGGDANHLTVEDTSQVTVTGASGAMGVAGAAGGVGGVGGSGGPGVVTSGTGGTTGTGGSGGVGPDVSTPGGTLTASGAPAFGPGSAGASWGTLDNDGTLEIPSGSTLTVPAGVTVPNAGTIDNAGAVNGAGDIVNTGRIIGTGTVDTVALDITVHNTTLSFDENRSAPDPHADQVVLASTVADAGQSLPTPTSRGRVFDGWFTDPAAGTLITGSTDLGSTGPRSLVLYAHYHLAPSRSSVSVVPDASAAVYGQPVRAIASTSSAGTVRFSVDGLVLGTGQRTDAGQATSPVLSDPATGDPLEPGDHQVTAAFDPDNGDLDSTSTVTMTIDRAATTLDLTITRRHLTATPTPVAPGAGRPSGDVVFSDGAVTLGTAPVVDGVAVLDTTLPVDGSQSITASYSGDARFTESVGATTRDNPSLKAVVTSRPDRHHWFRHPVKVRFVCAVGTAPLTKPCPTSTVLSKDGVHRVTRTIRSTDGGFAQVRTRSLRVDQTAPKVRIRHVRGGATYAVPPRPTCTARDRTSGLTAGGCRLTRKVIEKAHVTTIRYVARATDRAGNKARTTLVITVRRQR